MVPKPDLLNLSRLAEALVELEAAPLHSSAAIDVTDPQLLRRVPMIPLVTRFGRLDLLNSEAHRRIAGVVRGAQAGRGRGDRRWRGGPRRRP